MSSLRQFRFIAFVEGISFILLLFAAMPLKYLAGQPMAVRIVGALHGILFLLFVLALIRVSVSRSWSPGRALVAFVSSLVPFGTFVFDRSLRREIAGELRAAGGAWRVPDHSAGR